MHNNRALLRSSNLGVLLVDPSLLVSCEGLLPVRPTPWERDGLGKPESYALSNGAGRETLGTCIARGVRSGFGESESAHAVMSESRSLSRATLAGALTLFACRGAVCFSFVLVCVRT